MHGITCGGRSPENGGQEETRGFFGGQPGQGAGSFEALTELRILWLLSLPGIMTGNISAFPAQSGWGKAQKKEAGGLPFFVLAGGRLIVQANCWSMKAVN